MAQTMMYRYVKYILEVDIGIGLRINQDKMIKRVHLESRAQFIECDVI